MNKISMMILMVLVMALTLVPMSFAEGVKEKAYAPLNAGAKFINKVVTGTINTVSTAGTGLATDTNEFGKDIYRSVGGEV